MPALPGVAGALRQSVSSRSLLSSPPTVVLPGVAFPAVGPVGLGSPPFRFVGCAHQPSVLCSTTTARRPSRPASLGAGGAIPGRLPPFVSRLRLADGRKPHVRARALGHPVPLLFREIVSRRRLALPRARVPPLMTGPALRPRGCPVCLAVAPPGLLPSGHWKPSAFPSILPRDILSDHNYTNFGAPSRGLSPCSP